MKPTLIYGCSKAMHAYLDAIAHMKTDLSLYEEMTQRVQAHALLKTALDEDISQLEFLVKALSPYQIYEHDTLPAWEAMLAQHVDTLDDTIEACKAGEKRTTAGGLAYMEALRNHELYLLEKVSDYRTQKEQASMPDA